MKRNLATSTAAVLALALAVPAFAGGSHCSGAKTSATTADAQAACAGKNKSTAWGGAWLQRSPDGSVVVAEVAKGSPAAKSGLKSGDVVLAVNGYDLSSSEDRAMCASKASCSVGSAVTYKVQRGNSTKNIKLKLIQMPDDASQKLLARQASFDPALAAAVLPTED